MGFRCLIFLRAFKGTPKHVTGLGAFGCKVLLLNMYFFVLLYSNENMHDALVYFITIIVHEQRNKILQPILMFYCFYSLYFCV